MSESRIFVAGATGFTGREVVRLARERGIDTIAHVRPDSTSLARWRERLGAMGATVDTTAWEIEAMCDTIAAHRPTHVFALLGTTRARAREEKRASGHEAGYDEVDYGLTMLLYRAVEAHSPSSRFVYLSSAGLSDREPSNAYLRARHRVESALRGGSVPFTIARPSIISGERDEPRLGEKVGAAMASGALAFAGALGAKKLRERYRPTTNTELAAALLRLAFDPAQEGAIVESEDLRAP